MSCLDGIVWLLRGKLPRDGTCQEKCASEDLFKRVARPSDTVLETESGTHVEQRMAQHLYKAGQKFMLSTREALAEKRARRHERDLVLWIESGVTPRKCNCINVALRKGE